jgi:hypothetical protein
MESIYKQGHVEVRMSVPAIACALAVDFRGFSRSEGLLSSQVVHFKYLEERSSSFENEAEFEEAWIQELEPAHGDGGG